MSGAESASGTDAAGLLTREIFLDTQVYQSHQNNLDNPSFRTLRDLIAEDRIRLHITDITLEEILSHIRDEFQAARSELDRLQTKIGSLVKHYDIGQRVGGPLIKPIEMSFDEAELEAIRRFEYTLRTQFKVHWHSAADLEASSIFSDYFAKRPPFENKSSKEFPDAFVIKSLGMWCQRLGRRMHVVTADKAMRSAAEAAGLIVADSLKEILQAATAADTPAVRMIIEQAIDNVDDEARLDLAQTAVTKIGFLYFGDKPDGEVEEVEVVDDPQVTFFEGLYESSDAIRAIVHLSFEVTARIVWVDYDSAIYDREDGVVFNTETVASHERSNITIKYVAEIDPDTMQITEWELITDQIWIHDAADEDF